MGFDVMRRSGSARMEINGIVCEFNLPLALKQQFNGREEVEQGLPPYSPRQAFLVDEYPACPDSWMKSGRDLASYFVPVKTGRGIWIDFNGNANHTHDIAALVSIQGVNAVTGQKTDLKRLEQYRTKCPVHKTDFGPERFCEKCGFKWPAQNYLATTGTPSGYFWLDGFRAKDGTVRQFVFTEETMRGVAAQIIGKERVFAIGITFFLSKEPKPIRATAFRSVGFSKQPMFDVESMDMMSSPVLYSKGPTRGGTLSHSVRPKSIEVAAGSRIRQQVYTDPKEIEYWADEPAGTIVINYVDEETADAIIKAGKKDLTAGGEGFMQGLDVGNVQEMKQ